MGGAGTHGFGNDGVRKPLHYAENAQRFAHFADKIVHIVIDTWPDTDAWYGPAWLDAPFVLCNVAQHGL